MPPAPRPRKSWRTRSSPIRASPSGTTSPRRSGSRRCPSATAGMGAMIFGGPEREHLQLNEDTLYSGEPPADLRSIDITKNLDQVVAPDPGQQARRGRCLRHEELAGPQPAVLPAARRPAIWTSPRAAARSPDYRRWLDLATGTAGRQLPARRRDLHARDLRQPSRPGDRDPPARRASPARSPSAPAQPRSTPPPRSASAGEGAGAGAGSCPGSSPAGR